MYSVITYYNIITIYKEDFMTNIKKLLQILIPGIILAIIVYALFLFFGGTILYLLGLKYNNLLSLAKFFGIFLILSMIHGLCQEFATIGAGQPFGTRQFCRQRVYGLLVYPYFIVQMRPG